MLRIGLIDDQKLFRKSVILALATFDDVSLTLEAENGKELLDKMEVAPVDVLLLDIQMPVMDGFEAGMHVLKQYPEVKILMLTGLEDAKTIKRVIDSGLHGIITKSVHPQELESAIHSVYEEGYYFEPRFAEIVTRIYEKGEDFFTGPIQISAREQQVLELAFQGYTAKEIGGHLHLSPKTVEKHKSNLIAKTASKTFIGVITFALVHQIISIDELRSNER